MKTFLTLLAALAISSSANAADIKLQNPPINKKAPNFIAVNSYGKTIQLSDLKGSPVILEWTNHECPYVARHYNENNMQSIQKMASDAGSFLFVFFKIFFILKISSFGSKGFGK